MPVFSIKFFETKYLEIPMRQSTPSLEQIYVQEQMNDKVEPILDWVSHVRSELLFNKYSPSRKNLEKLSKYGEELSVIIKEAFNLNVRVNLLNDHHNFSVMVPHMGKESVMYYGYADSIQSSVEDTSPESAEFREFVEKNHKAFAKSATASVDYENATVTGAFAEMESQLFLDPIGTFPHFESDEITGFILHEIGHIFMFFSTLHRSRAVMGSLNSIARDQFKLPVEDRPKAMRVRLQDAAACGELPKGAVETYLRNDSDEGLVIMSNFATLTAESLQSHNNLNATESKFSRLHGLSNEVGADVFVSKVGYGITIVRGLDKWNRLAKGKNWKERNGDYEHSHAFFAAIGSLFKQMLVAAAGLSILSALAAGAAITGGHVLALGISFLTGELIKQFTITIAYNRSGVGTDYTYDNNRDRFIRIYQNEIAVLTAMHKSRSVHIRNITSRIKEAQRIVEIVEAISNKSNPYRTLADMLWKGSRDLKHLGDVRNSLEAIAANPLYLASLAIIYE